jgi:hypothetical protein
MRSLSRCLIIALVLSCLAAVPALAGTFNLGSFTVPPPQSVGFSRSSVHGAFTDNYTFTLSGSATADALVASFHLKISNGLNITSFKLFSGTPGFGTLVATGVDNSAPGLSEWLINPVGISSGSFYLEIIGGLAPSATVGAYSGNLNLNTVPEPSALLLVAMGIGTIGCALRLKKS